jgi:hypothetical protein
MQRDWAELGMVLSTFLRVIAQSLQDHCAGAAHVDKTAVQIGAIAFIHRFGSSLNDHVHFRVCVIDGVFEQVAGDSNADVASRASPPSIVCGRTVVMRRRMKGRKSSQRTGVWWHNPHPTLRLMSTSVGEWLRRRL